MPCPYQVRSIVATKLTPVQAQKSAARHPFGELLAQHRARKPGLTQTCLAELAGYNQAILVRMCQGKKDLTGPSGRERVVRLVETLADQGALTTLDEANALLLSADMPPLFERQLTEARLITRLAKVPAGQRTRRTNLPAPLTSFVGRANELAEVRRLLGLTRLLTLTGAGGSGKTRLAQRIAADMLIAYSDGVWYTELAVLADPALIADAVVRALGLIASDRPTQDQLLDYLRERHVLLVLDNCEHLIDAVAAFSIEVLRACPRVTILTTSREALNVDGETAWRVPPMQPDEAGQLFVDRAAATRPNGQINTADETVAHICQRLDGMPLAIELAAARLNSLSLSDIAARLDDRFNLLAVGRRGALPRHQTLRALIDWSYDSLSEPEQAVFRRLGVFVGGWVMEDAQQVVADDSIQPSDVVVLLAQLTGKSLVTLSERRGTTRYYLLETIREYALEKLKEKGELTNMCLKHAEIFIALAERAEPHMHDGEQKLWLPRMEHEHDNVRAVLAWSLSSSGDAQIGLRLACRMWLFWWVGHVTEGTVWLKRLLDAASVTTQTFELGRAYLGYGTLILATAEQKDIKIILDEAIRLLEKLDDPEGVTFALYILGCCQDFWNDLRVQRLLDEGWSLERWHGNRLALEYATYMCMRHHLLHPKLIGDNFDIFQHVVNFAETRGDQQTAALAYFDLSRSALARQNVEQAYQFAEQALSVARAIGACWEECAVVGLLGEIWRWKGDLDTAQRYAAERFELLDRYGWPEEFKTGSFILLGRIARDRGHLLTAQNYFVRAFQVHNQWTPPAIFDGLSSVACVQQEYERAARLTGISEANRDVIDMPRYRQEELDIAPYIAKARAALGDDAYDAAYAEGRAMPLEQAIVYALNDKMPDGYTASGI